ncbi:Met-10+ like-protein [Teladorsagia circumcincta]|uniref:Met-10+ like-protein n=1 Tax=Teladorsagia circumcincta TaxID=45464 RepID=A0A2G9UC28_TELCI|nr:Met-10+ like-protein [Teladorsagia circumcincta]
MSGFASSTAVPNCVLEIPAVVRGMQDLEKEAFKKNITVVALKVDASKVSIIQGKVRLEKYLFKNLGRIKNIMNADDSRYKLFVFDPNAVQENSMELKSQIESMIKEHTGAGEEDYVTETLEGGVRFRLDFSKVFWNSRLSREHERVVKLFDSRSLVYDACAGVGPFVLPAIKKGRALHALANDLNPESVRWLKENALLNKATKDAQTSENPPSGAHVMLNLPGYAVNFLPSFRGVLAQIFSADALCTFPVKVYCYLFAKAHEDVPDDWYKKRAVEMVREFLNEDEAHVDLVHHVGAYCFFTQGDVLCANDIVLEFAGQ